MDSDHLSVFQKKIMKDIDEIITKNGSVVGIIHTRNMELERLYSLSNYLFNHEIDEYGDSGHFEDSGFDYYMPVMYHTDISYLEIAVQIIMASSEGRKEKEVTTLTQKAVKAIKWILVESGVNDDVLLEINKWRGENKKNEIKFCKEHFKKGAIAIWINLNENKPILPIYRRTESFISTSEGLLYCRPSNTGYYS